MRRQEVTRRLSGKGIPRSMQTCVGLVWGDWGMRGWRTILEVAV